MLRYIFMLFLCGSYVKSEHLGLEEGSACQWLDYPGVCVSIYKCLSSFIDISTKNYAPICCFRGKEPIICCTDCELVNDTRKMIIDKKLGILYKTGQKAEDACTNYKQTVDYPCRSHPTRVWNKFLKRTNDSDRNCWKVNIHTTDFNYYVIGRSAVKEEFPHMALLGYGLEVDAALWLCGGSLISDRFILTAGHCLSKPKIGDVNYIALGILSRSDPPEQWEKYNVKNRYRHPEYKPPSKYNDIALLETETQIKFSYLVRPACLHTKGDAEEILSSTGWGRLGHNKDLADTLQATLLNRFGEDDCMRQYPPHRLLEFGYNHMTQMCYGDTESLADSCDGDSGGPLQSNNYDEHKCVFTILGVTSAGKECGVTAGAGLYTRVYHFVPWIESIVWP